MLIELDIQDFILIDRAKLEFEPGLNILSGETGAGKSMVIGALSLLMGSQSSRDSVRLGAEKAVISAVFDVSEIQGIDGVFEELGIPFEDLSVLSREVSSKGKSIGRINGRPTSISVLRKIAALLVAIHGQNEQLQLFGRTYQLKMIDNYSGGAGLSKIADLYANIKASQDRLDALLDKSGGGAERRGFLEYQLSEIQTAQLQMGEDEELEAEQKLLSSTERIAQVLSYSHGWISESPENAQAALSEILSRFRKISGLSDDIDEMHEMARQLESQISDFDRALQRSIDSLNLNEERLYQVEARLDQINSLKLKFGNSVEEIIDAAARFEEELNELENIEELIESAKLQLQEAISAYDKEAAELTKIRKNSTAKLEQGIMDQLADLNMKDARINLKIMPGPRSRDGSDEVDFLISTAVGTPLKNIKSVVSGGELSRIMLAIKIVTEQENSMIFDEVDAGISGRTAHVVGEKLLKLSEKSQLICITHLPQIAVFADNNILIEKSSDSTKTTTEVRRLESAEVASEIARLVGGGKITDLTMEHARGMLEIARRDKWQDS